MRILLITETVPYPPDTGGRIKTGHTLEALGREHEVHCHAFIRRAGQGDAAVEALGRTCASVTMHLVPRSVPREAAHAARSLFRRLPLTVARHYSGAAMRQMASACRDHRIDVVYCDHLSTLEYGRRLHRPIIHDAHNVEHLVVRRFAETVPRRTPQRLLLRREARMLLDYERQRYPECALIFAVSDIDAAAIASLAPEVPVVPVPIGVASVTAAPADAVTEAPEVLFVGTLDWPPNGEAVDYFSRAIWPTVLRQVPQARLTIVGRGQSATATSSDCHPTIRFTGRVDDVQPFFRRSRVMVVPIRSGSGMRVKILEAFARGVPVVSTSIGIEGIAAVDGTHALIADSPEQFAAATIRVLRNRTLAERLSRAARDLALSRYDPGVVGTRMLEALARVFPTSPRPRRRASDDTHRAGDSHGTSEMTDGPLPAPVDAVTP